MSRKFFKALTLAVVVILIAVPVVYAAGSSYQPVEWETYQSGRPSYSLTYIGWVKGCKPDQPNNYDYKYRININASYSPDSFRIYSYNGTIQRNFSGKSPMGYLSGTYQYLCIGMTETILSGGGSNVARNLFVWIKR